MVKTCILIFLLITFQGARANLFTVISPQDNLNPGTLRWALQQSASNGTLIADTIFFNIPSTLPAARVIQLDSELPFVTSNVVIDATTQPGAPWGGTGDAKIVITPRVFQNCKRGFVIRDATNVEIYGFLIAGFINSDPTISERFSDAIFMWNVSNVTLGKITKGNSFTGNFNSIRHEAIPERNGDPVPAGIGNNIIIRSNTIGKNQTGRPLTREGVVNGVALFQCSNVIIGGQPDEINSFMVFLNAIRIGLKTLNPNDTSIIDITGNRFDPATSVPPLPFALPILGIEVNDNDLLNPGFHLLSIKSNIIQKYTTGITIARLKHPFNIVNNTIDLDRSHSLFPASLGIGVVACDSGTIGEPNAANTVHDCKNFGLAINSSKYIKISNNSIFCTPKGISISVPGVVIPKIIELVIDPSLVATGKTCASCHVEIFNTNSCNSEIYNGENFETSVTADNQGFWVYSGPLSCNTSFTTTSLSGSTSEFYTPFQFILDTSTIVVRDASCGRNNGSITGLRILNGVTFFWEDLLGNVVGSDTNLINVGPGFYRLVGVKQNLGCVLTTRFIEIKNIQPFINLSLMQIIQPSDCGGMGSIKNITVQGGPPIIFKYRWTNAFSVTVGNALDLINVGPGAYRLTVSVISDTTCSTSAGPFILTNQPAPNIDSSSVQITGATCGLANGSIQGLQINNPTGNQLFIWKNSSGIIVGNASSLLNVRAGRYKFLYKDDAPCDTLRTGYFNIINSGRINIDESSILIHPSGCTVNNGSITNLIITGASIYNWRKLSDNSVVGNSPNLFNVGPGAYQLFASDPVNGCRDSTSIINIPNSAIQPVIIGSSIVREETCNKANGSVFLSNINPPSGYQFKWVKNSTDTFSSMLSIINLSAGDYTLIAFDTNGCSQVAFHIVLVNHPGPKLLVNNARLSNDTCTQFKGSVTNLVATGTSLPFSYSWVDRQSSLVVSQQKDLINVGAGDYSMIIQDNNGCTDSSQLFHIVNVAPILPAPLYDEAYVKRNTSANLIVKNPGKGIYHMFEDPATLLEYNQNTTGNFVTPILRSDREYYIKLQVGACSSPASHIHINVIDFSKVFAPNSFSPNNDNINDIFRINVFGKIVIDYLEIYNRWGGQVFRTKDISKGWNGKFNNLDAPTGVYVWILQGYDIDGTVINLKGSLLLIR